MTGMSHLLDGSVSGFMRRHRATIRFLAATTLLFISGIYVYRTLADGIGHMHNFDYSIGAAQVVITLGGVLGTLVLSTFYHVVAVLRVQENAAPVRKLALAYALGQIMRYVPGKVFGIVFQINYLAPQVKGASIAIALLVQTFYDYAWTAVLVVLVVHFALTGNAWPMLAVIPVVILIWLVHHRGYLERLVARPWLLRQYLAGIDRAALNRPGHSLLATALVVAVWLPMLLGTSWGLSDTFGLRESLVLVALYLAAAVLSLLVVVVPSGLVVREALFIWLGAQFGLPAASLAFVGIFLRICLTFCEVLNALIFATLAGLRGTAGNTSPGRGTGS